MIRAAVPVLLVALALAPPAAAQEPAGSASRPGDDKLSAQAAAAQTELAAAEQLVAERRAALTAAEDALAELVRELEDEHRELSRGGPARDALLLGLADALDAARLRYQHELDQGRPLQRGLRRRLLLEAFESSTRVDDPQLARLVDWVRRRVADDLSARSSLDGVGRQEIDARLLAVLPPDETWPGFWNRDFHATLPESQAYVDALAAYEAAGDALARLRHPERYGPQGKPAPPGMVVVPGGSYQLGPGTGWRRGLVNVRLDPFFIDRREVSHQRYAVFVDAQPAPERAELLPRGWTLDERGYASFPEERRDHPVLHVDWEQAAAYAAWAGKRLPTENEWEAAAAGTAGLAYPWGNTWIEGAANGAGYATHTLPTGSFPEYGSPVGALDMAGNVWEWTATSEQGDTLQQPSPEALNMIIRGGSYRSPREELTTRARWTAAAQGAFEHPEYDRPIGFRCVQDL